MTVSPRPFYGRFAWAFDLLVERPVAAECDHIAATLSRRGVAHDGRLLDAGCGTGHYALGLARHGYRVTGLDLSPELIAVARQHPGAAAVDFVIGDLTRLPAGPPYDAVLCRGVLNDLLDDRSRRDAFLAFAGAMRSGGALVLDVRDWEETARRRTAHPVHEKTVHTDRGRLVFRGQMRLDHERRLLLVAERHVLTAGEETTSAEYDFAMRCWTRGELADLLADAGFGAVEYRSAYDPAVPLGATDRIVVVASRS